MLAAALRHEGVHRIFSSDLRRALHTAQEVAVALGLGASAVTALPELRERHLGILQARCLLKRQPYLSKAAVGLLELRQRQFGNLLAKCQAWRLRCRIHSAAAAASH